MSCKIRRKNKDEIVTEVALQFLDNYKSDTEENADLLLPKFINAFSTFNEYATIKINIENILIDLLSDYYRKLMINIAGQLIEQLVFYFMNTKIDKNKLFITNIENNTQRGKIHDIVAAFKFNNKENNEPIEFTQSLEVKSYNEAFGNITLTKNQRKLDKIKDPVYILCNYSLHKRTPNIIYITEIYLLLGNDINDNFDENGFLKSKHLSGKFNKDIIFSNNTNYKELLKNIEEEEKTEQKNKVSSTKNKKK